MSYPWAYFVPYEEDINLALQHLRINEARKRETQKPPTKRPHFNLASEEPPLLEDDGETGGMEPIEFVLRVSTGQQDFAAWPFTDEQLMTTFRTTKPTRGIVDSISDYFSYIRRGEARYLVIYEGDTPTEIMFAGYSGG